MTQRVSYATSPPKMEGWLEMEVSAPLLELQRRAALARRLARDYAQDVDFSGHLIKLAEQLEAEMSLQRDAQMLR